MHVLNPDKKYVRRQRNTYVFQFTRAALALLCLVVGALAGAGTDSAASSFTRVMQSVFGFLSFGVGVLLIYNYFNGSRGKTRVISTGRTLAIKLRNKPAIFIKRENCVAYGPVKCTFIMEDGSEFSLHEIDIPFQNVNEIKTFIFSHWWSEETLRALEEGFEETLPMPHWHLRAILVGFLLVFPTLAMAMILLNVGEGGLHWSFGVIFMGLVNMIVLLRLLNMVGARNQERSDYRVYLSEDFGYGDGFSIEPTRYLDMEQ